MPVPFERASSERVRSMRSSKSAIGRPQVVATVTASSSGRHMVPKPVAPVSPYAVSTMSKSSSFCIRSIRTTGTVAAP